MKRLAALLMILCAGVYAVGCTPAEEEGVIDDGDVTAPIDETDKDVDVEPNGAIDVEPDMDAEDTVEPDVTPAEPEAQPETQPEAEPEEATP